MLLFGITSPFGWAGVRTTDDTANDLVQSLTASGRLDDAEWVCRNQLRRHPEGLLPHAKWSARLAQVLAERNTTTIFDGKVSDLSQRIDPAIDSACQPLVLLLSSYPESPSVVFLHATRLAIRQRILRAAIVAASVSPPDPSLTDELLSKFSRLQYDVNELQETARREWSARTAETTRGAKSPGRIAADQYQRLLQELSLQRVSIALLQSELFPRGSDDYRAAAADAAVVAEEAILTLPDGSEAKRVARALRAESLLRSGDVAAAGEIIAAAGGPSAANDSPRWTALRIRLALAKGDSASARAICDAYYRSSGSADAQPQNLEVDFAKLDVLLADAKDDGQVARWIDRIERRGGAFARRRAESIAIALLRSTASPDGMADRRRLSPALIAAQGEDWLRRKDPRQAAGLLREAALAEPVPEAAFQYAAKSAAAAIAAKDSQQAIEVLRQTARKHAIDDNATQLTMQAALLASKPFAGADDPKRRLTLLEDLLKEVSQTWPSSEAALKANEWLCRILVQSGRREQAARDALELLTLGQRVDQFEPTLTLWFDYLSKLELDQVTNELNSLAATLGELAAENDAFAAPVHRAAILFFDRPQMAFDATTLTGADPSTEFLRRLERFRASGGGGGEAIATDAVDDTILLRARWRLQRDAMLDAATQPAIGSVLLGWPDASEWQTATAQFWSAPDDTSVKGIVRLALSGDAKPQSLRRGMRLLAGSDSKAAKRSAIELADRLAATMKIGNEDWYQAKLQAIEWLAEIGDQEQSRKRAQYVLLLHRPVDGATRKRFEAFAKN
ncbi:hypothetical protein [Stieleria neptunia]|uniref:hypothetical protein n=1 Tax=Stieleria neptunia TaxID=2527979 RepID=UPI0011A3AD27|nr:hypothetical protein [Stieleria neptunia]